MIKSGELAFKPVKDYAGKFKTGTVGPWACEMYECTGDMQLQAFRKGAGDNLLSGLSMTVCMSSHSSLYREACSSQLGSQIRFLKLEQHGTGRRCCPGTIVQVSSLRRSKVHRRAPA